MKIRFVRLILVIIPLVLISINGNNGWDVFGENQEKSHNDVFNQISNVNSKSEIMGMYGMTLGIASLIISISIASIIYQKTSSESRQHSKELQEFTKFTLLYHDGNTYFNQNDFVNAEKYYLRALELKPNDKTVLHNLGATYAKIENWKKSLEINKEFTKLYPNEVGAWGNLGLAYDGTNDPINAKFSYYEGLIREPNNGNILHNLGKLYDEKFHEPYKALLCYDKIIRDKLFEGTALTDTIFNKGKLFHDENKFDLALIEYNRTLDLDPRHVKALQNKANMLLKMGNIEKSLKCCEVIEKFFPEYDNVLLTKANILHEKQSSECLSVIDEFLLMHPNDSTGHYNRGVFLLSFASMDDAIKEWKLTIELDPNNVNAYGNIAGCHMTKEEYDEAIMLLEKAISIDPNHVGNLEKMGATLCLIKNYERAIDECFLKILSLQPLNITNVRNTSLALAKINNFPLANEFWYTYQELIQLNVSHRTILGYDIPQ